MVHARNRVTLVLHSRVSTPTPVRRWQFPLNSPTSATFSERQYHSSREECELSTVGLFVPRPVHPHHRNFGAILGWGATYYRNPVLAGKRIGGKWMT